MKAKTTTRRDRRLGTRPPASTSPPVNALAIVDCETTGFGRNDRVVEVACILVDPKTMEIVDEYDTLINPERDPGPSHIHGITPSMLSSAPVFEEVAGALAARLNGKVLAAHNLPFDSRMLAQEYDRIQSPIATGEGFCTLRPTKAKLGVACQQHGVRLGDAHRALSDARAVAGLLRILYDDPAWLQPAHVPDLRRMKIRPITLRREAVAEGMGITHMTRAVNTAVYQDAGTDSAIISYMDMLDWVVDDLVIDQTEDVSLIQAAASLGMGWSQIRSAHEIYMQSLVDAALRDGVVTEDEHKLMTSVAALLGVHVEIPEVSAQSAPTVALTPGMRVAFTGTAVVDGQLINRDDLCRQAIAANLSPVPTVTKKGCDLVVAADPASLSGKAKSARSWGIPIISVEAFNDLLRHDDA